jgi:glycosyltransferase involved in cell wall biosynthesis
VALALLQQRPDLRARFPRSIHEGPTGPYARWLCTEGAHELGLSPRAVAHLQRVFAQRLGEHVRQVYDFHAELRDRFPLAFTPAGQRPFLRWLLRRGKEEFGLADEEILWFLFECAGDPHRGVAATYRRTPEWQRRFPHGLAAAGPRDLIAWLGTCYGRTGGWLDGLDLSGALSPLEEQASGPATPPGVNVLGHFCYPSGLSVAVHALARSLRSVGVGTSCRDVPARLTSDLPGHSDYLGLEVFDHTLLCLAPEPLTAVCYPLSGLAPRAGVRRIAIWYWELETAPSEWARHAGLIDEVWAPTQFITGALRAVMPIPVVHMLPAVTMDEFPALPRRHFGLPGDRFLFLFLFDMSSVMERKNPLGLIEAYRRAFRPDDRVTLAIKVIRGDSDPESLSRLRTAAHAAGVLVIDRVLSRSECNALMNTCDCYVSLHRSEGFGLTLAEAMLLGKPVIATGYSGNLDFMAPTSSLLVGYQRLALDRDWGPYRRGWLWADPSIDEAAEHLRRVYGHPDEARALGARGRTEAARLLSLEAAGQRMLRRLSTRPGERRGLSPPSFPPGCSEVSLRDGPGGSPRNRNPL